MAIDRVTEHERRIQELEAKLKAQGLLIATLIAELCTKDKEREDLWKKMMGYFSDDA